ncbi:DMT family transporter [Echinimonas agarilytica]|uniref:DMT family transporter n=1 Tax=Echinimonas agarilytica TaxID=1215918 RepID=A0AA41W681_9GAMM|nr:DMT family transporter [Echinimonas agarilytica]MCM2679383.1 DMT family transporter [Echinimonas agarilytica]
MPKALQPIVLTTIALIAFAANSVLCRMALKDEGVDPSFFTLVRLLSAVGTLLIIALFTNRMKGLLSQGSWLAGFALFAYAAAFSFGYVSLNTATGALVLFAAVQLSMLIIHSFSGHRISKSELFGGCCAAGGLVYWLLPELQQPTVFGFLLMLLAGVSWAFYTVLGRSSTDSMSATAANFLRASVMATPLILLIPEQHSLGDKGIILAITSGAIASGLGYVIWYVALKHLSGNRAGLVQLLVPMIAALGGIIWVNEPITLRLLVAGLLVLGGVYVAMTPWGRVGKN